MARSARKTIAGSAVSAAKKVIGRRPAADEEPAPAKKAASTAKKTASTAKKSTTAAAKKATATAAKKTEPAKKAASTAKKTTTAAAKKATATAAKKAEPAKKAASTAKKTTTAAAKKATATAKKAAPARKTSALVVKEGEEAWTKAELKEVTGELNEHADRLRGELNGLEQDLDTLLRNAGDGAGHDQADMGATSFERDHELTLVNNAREMLAQIERALGRIVDGSYGVCESCGNPIGKMRLMAFPRATLCMSCKQREERR